MAATPERGRVIREERFVEPDGNVFVIEWIEPTPAERALWDEGMRTWLERIVPEALAHMAAASADEDNNAAAEVLPRRQGMRARREQR